MFKPLPKPEACTKGSNTFLDMAPETTGTRAVPYLVNNRIVPTFR
jgi:hypothetical protein